MCILLFAFSQAFHQLIPLGCFYCSVVFRRHTRHVIVFFFQVCLFKIESWMNEKKPLVASLDYGQDEDAAQKLLAKHKALQADMGMYRRVCSSLSKRMETKWELDTTICCCFC